MMLIIFRILWGTLTLSNWTESPRCTHRLTLCFLLFSSLAWSSASSWSKSCRAAWFWKTDAPGHLWTRPSLSPSRLYWRHFGFGTKRWWCSCEPGKSSPTPAFWGLPFSSQACWRLPGLNVRSGRIVHLQTLTCQRACSLYRRTRRRSASSGGFLPSKGLWCSSSSSTAWCLLRPTLLLP